MEVIREKGLRIVDKDNVLLETSVVGGEFVLTILGEVRVTEELDKSLYENLNTLMNNKYLFMSEGYSYQTDKEIVWLSDHTCDFSNQKEMDRISRLLLRREDDSIVITGFKPFCSKNNIPLKTCVIAFSPCGNGFFSKNVDTSMTFQDDIAVAFNNAIRNKYSKGKIREKRK